METQGKEEPKEISLSDKMRHKEVTREIGENHGGKGEDEEGGRFGIRKKKKGV